MTVDNKFADVILKSLIYSKGIIDDKYITIQAIKEINKAIAADIIYHIHINKRLTQEEKYIECERIINKYLKD